MTFELTFPHLEVYFWHAYWDLIHYVSWGQGTVFVPIGLMRKLIWNVLFLGSEYLFEMPHSKSNYCGDWCNLLHSVMVLDLSLFVFYDGYYQYHHHLDFLHHKLPFCNPICPLIYLSLGFQPIKFAAMNERYHHWHCHYGHFYGYDCHCYQSHHYW